MKIIQAKTHKLYIIKKRSNNKVSFAELLRTAPEPVTPMMPPIGVKASVQSASGARLTWTDNTLGRSQRIHDSRYYVVRYNPKLARKQRFVNSTRLSVELFDLRPDTEYEFSVKVVKGQRRSTWSLSVFNRTLEAGSVFKYITLISSQSFITTRRRNNSRDRGRLVPQLLDWDQQFIGPQLLGRIFQKASNFTASSHQNARFSI